MELDSYTFVLLKRGPRAAEYSGEELDRLQEQHLGHLRAMTEQGHLLIAGPFSEQPDESLRGIRSVRPGWPDGGRRHDLVDEARIAPTRSARGRPRFVRRYIVAGG